MIQQESRLKVAAIYDAWELVEHWDVMGCHHYSCTLLGDILEQSHDVAGGLRVEISRRLIGDDDLRIVEQGTGDGHTLLFSTGELVRHLVDFLYHAYFVEHFLDALVSVLLVFPFGSLEHELEVLAHAAVVEQLEVLEDDAQFLAQGWNVLASDGLEVSAEDFCLVGLTLHEVKLAVEGLQE